jgi:hypothetical protein
MDCEPAVTVDLGNVSQRRAGQKYSNIRHNRCSTSQRQQLARQKASAACQYINIPSMPFYPCLAKVNASIRKELHVFVFHILSQEIYPGWANVLHQQSLRKSLHSLRLWRSSTSCCKTRLCLLTDTGYLSKDNLQFPANKDLVNERRRCLQRRFSMPFWNVRGAQKKTAKPPSYE